MATIRLFILLLITAALHAQSLDLTHATIVVPPAWTGPPRKAVAMLVEEVEKRTQIRWPVQPSATAGASIVLAIANAGPGRGLPRPGGVGNRSRDGQRCARPAVRRRETAPQTAHGPRRASMLPADLHVDDRAAIPLRGHQLGYRPKTNSYDGWTSPMWEQYIRDLACSAPTPSS